jgi:hypothetical protein
MKITEKFLDDLLNKSKYEPAKIKINNITILFDSYDVYKEKFEIVLSNQNSITAIIEIQ